LLVVKISPPLIKMTTKQNSYYGLQDQYGWCSRYPDHNIRSSDLSPALSSSCPYDSYKPMWNSNYPTKSSYVDGASMETEAAQVHSYYSRPLALTDSSSESAKNSFVYNYPATVYGSSVYDLHMLRKNLRQNSHKKPKKLQIANPVKKQRLNEEPRSISRVGGDYDSIDTPRTFSIYYYNDIDGAYRVDLKIQKVLNLFHHGWECCNKKEDLTKLKRLQVYSPEDQYSLEDGGHKDLWNVHSNRRCSKRAMSNCYDGEDDMQDSSCDYGIEYDCFDDDSDLLNPYHNAKRQRRARSCDYEVEYDCSDDDDDDCPYF